MVTGYRALNARLLTGVEAICTHDARCLVTPDRNPCPFSATCRRGLEHVRFKRGHIRML